MFLNFKCPACENQIQAQYQNIGDWVECPVCSFVQVVPDPPLPSGASYNGYLIDSIVDSSLLWLTYSARGDQEMPGKDVTLKIPSTFFLKNVSDFDSFANAAISGGSLNIEGIAKLLDKSLVHGKFHFIYESLPGAHLLSASAGILRPSDAAAMAAKMASAMDKAWERVPCPHLNISPQTVMLSPRLETLVLDTGLSKYLLKDTHLLSMGFNIWDLRYASPETRAGAHNFSSPTADIYSLGALLFFILSGRHPFEEEEFDQNTPFPEFSSGVVLPEPLRVIVRKMTAFKPEERHQSWKELIKELEFSCDSLLAVPNLEGRKTVRCFLGRASNQADRSSNPQGLTHTNIKIDKKLKLQVPKRKPQVSETIAKLFPMSSNLSSAQGLKAQREAEKKRSDRNLKFLLTAAAALALILMPLSVYLILVKHDKPEAPHASHPSVTPSNSTTMPSQPLSKLPPSPVRAGKQKDSRPSSKSGVSEQVSNPLLKLMKEADDFWAANPEAFDEAAKKYDKVSEYAFKNNDFSLMDAIRDKMNDILEEKNQKVESILKKLDAIAMPLCEAGQGEAAAKVYLDYKGPLESESLQQRISAVEKAKKISMMLIAEGNVEKAFLSGCLEQSLAMLNKIDDRLLPESLVSKREKLINALKGKIASVMPDASPLLEKAVPLICSLDGEAVAKELNSVASDSPAKEYLDALAKQAALFATINKAFIESAKNSEGKTIKLHLKGSSPEKCILISCRTDTLVFKSEKGELISVRLKDISLESQLDFASKLCNLDSSPLVCLLIGLQAEDSSYINGIYPKLPLGLGALIAAGLEDVEAKSEFTKMFDSCQLPYDKSDYSTFIHQMLKKDFPASKLLTMLDEYKAKYSSTHFFETQRGVIENIEKNCRRAGAVMSQRLVVDNDFLKGNNIGLQGIIEKAQPGTVIELKRGSYSTPGGAPLSISKPMFKLICEEGVDIDSGIKITADKVQVSGVHSKNGKLEITSSSGVKVENCSFFAYGSSIKSSSLFNLDNTLLKGLQVNSSKNGTLRHCTVISSNAGAEKKWGGNALVFRGDDLEAFDSVFYGENLAIVVLSSEKRRFTLSNCLIYGESGACAEMLENGSISSKNVAKTEASLKKYLKVSKCKVAPVQFQGASSGDYSILKGTVGSGSASDGKDCGVLQKTSDSPSSGIKKTP